MPKPRAGTTPYRARVLTSPQHRWVPNVAQDNTKLAWEHTPFESLHGSLLGTGFMEKAAFVESHADRTADQTGEGLAKMLAVVGEWRRLTTLGASHTAFRWTGRLLTWAAENLG